MCGILFFDVTGVAPATAATVRSLPDALKHRGPDGSACELVETAGYTMLMAFHRLAVINPRPGDLGSGMQPISYKGATLVCNGEVYNYVAIAGSCGVAVEDLGSDVHVLLHLLLLSGDGPGLCDALDSVDGEFALVYIDRATGIVLAARDPWGVRPLFLARDLASRVVAFASEAKALIGAPGVAHVEVFPPGHVMVLHGAGAGAGAGAGLNAESCRDFRRHSRRHDASDLRTLVETAIRKRIQHSDRPVGVLCSGGLDSAIVTALVAADASLRDRVRVFSVRYDSGHSDDAFYAQMLCSQCRVDLEFVTFGLSDVVAAIEPVIRACETCDPNTVRAAIPMYLLARHIATATDVKVVLSGEGADELCCGYAYLRLAPDADALNAESRRLIRQLHMFDLLRADRCFGAFGLEVRVPYLDLALVDVVSRLPGGLKEISAATGFVEKRLLRDAFRDVRTPIGKLLHDSHVIDRPKEKLSDGCGFSFVPQLLAHLGGDSGRLVDREAAERAHYRAVFDAVYGEANRALVVPRVMPVWTEGMGGATGVLGAPDLA